MDCHSDETVDLCSEPECLKSTITLKNRKGLKAPHKPNHNMLKVHRILFNRDTGRAEKNAKEALEAAQETLSDLKAQKEPMPRCAHCKETVSYPCWYCVDCTSKHLEHEHRFINHPYQLSFPQRRDSSVRIASTNASHLTKLTPRSTSLSGSSNRLSKRSFRQKIDCNLLKDSLNLFRIDLGRWKPCFRNS